MRMFRISPVASAEKIHIKYDGIGFIPLGELMKGKTAQPKSRRSLRTTGSRFFEFY